VREFFWLSVIGRTAVFLYVLWLTFGRGLGTTLLLIMALPDLASALWSAWLLAPTDDAAALLCLGIGNVAVATTFGLFSEPSPSHEAQHDFEREEQHDDDLE
jgi:hypothetical protein